MFSLINWYLQFKQFQCQVTVSVSSHIQWPECEIYQLLLFIYIIFLQLCISNIYLKLQSIHNVESDPFLIAPQIAREP